MSLPDLAGRTVVITGASRGIGAGLAERFAARGMNLGLCARSGSALPTSDTVAVESVDVSDEAAVDAFAKRVAEKFGSIDLWINNAGVLTPVGPVRDIPGTGFEEHLRINVMGVVHGTRAFLSHRREHGGGGVLVNISSGAAWAGYAGWGPYCAGKAAVDRITECVHLEEGATGLRAYAVAPGVVDTDMQALIRSCSPEVFPMVDKFHEMKASDSFNTLDFVSDHLLAIAFDPEAQPDQVVVRLPAEKG